MSAPLDLTPDDLQALGAALARLTSITKDTGVEFDSYGSLVACVRQTTIGVGYSSERGYFLQDQVGT